MPNPRAYRRALASYLTDIYEPQNYGTPSLRIAPMTWNGTGANG